ncbi:hypothetical protein Ntsu_49270 [Nocardia sp. IFM 10818]
MRAQRRVDLAEFDAEAADLQLEVRAAHVFDGAVTDPAAHQISGAIHTKTGRARIAAEGARDEPFRSETGPPQIALGQRGTGQVELTDYPGRDRAQPRIQHDRTDSGESGADGDRLPRGQLGTAGRENRGLGGTVRIEEGPPGRGPAIDEPRTERVPGDDHDPQIH